MITEGLGDDRGDGRVVTQPLRGGPEFLHLSFLGLVRRVTQAEVTKAARGQRRQTPTHRRERPTPAQREARTALPRFSRGHGLPRDEQIMQAAGTAEARTVCGFQHAGACAQFSQRALLAEELQEALGRHAGPFLEHTLQVAGA